MRKKITLLLLLLIGFFASAQTLNVKGVVKDAKTGDPLPGVSILIKGTTVGTQTDFDGLYSFTKVKKGETLVFNYLGYTIVEVLVTKETIDVSLEESAETLDEIVVVGYGKQKRKDVTGSVSIVGEETLNVLKPIDATSALQGTTSGVAVNLSSGAPGAKVNILIRGVSSNTNNQPLTIVDGYEGDLNSINPNDIESITVLKDAQAAIYGIKGANGVVLVTTKIGKKNKKAIVKYDTYAALQQTTKKLDYLNATEYAVVLNEAYAASGQSIPYTNLSDLGKGTDWQDELFNNAMLINHNISLAGGGDNFRYFVSASRTEQDGIIAKDKSNFERNNIKINIGIDITEKLNFSLISNYFTSTSRGFDGSLLFNGLNYAPTFGVDEDDTNNFLGIEVVNPLSLLSNTYGETNGNGIEGNFKLEYKPIEGLNVVSRVGYKIYNEKLRSFTPIQDYGSSKVYNKTQSSVYQYKTTSSRVLWESFATYQKTFAKNHNTSFTVGTSVQNDLFDGIYVTGFDVPNNSYEFADISLTNTQSEQRSLNTGNSDIRLTSYFGRVQYDYKGKYLFSGLIRRDGASVFAEDKRVDNFWSATSGWKISDEEFLKDSKTISFLKLRASYGTLGNLVGNNLYRSLLNGEGTYVFDGSLVDGVAQGGLPNPLATWETAVKLDIGLDLNLFDDKLTFVADYFEETRKDLLIESFPVSGLLGAGAAGGSNPTVNAGTSKNTGAELAINYNAIAKNNFSLNFGYNITYVKNKVTDVLDDAFVEGGSFGVGNLAPSRMEVGQPIGYFYGLVSDGIFQNQAEIDAHPSQSGLGASTSPGDIRYKDTNNDGVINFDDRVNIGKPQADFYMGFNVAAKYKNWDFTSYLYAELGKDIVRNYERFLPNVNKPAYYLDRWTGAGTSNSVPRLTNDATNNKLFSDFFVEDASFLRMQNIQIGYSFSQNLLEKIGLSKLRLYSSINNLFTLTDYSGFDPSINDGAIGAGIDSGNYPSARQFLLGLNVEF
ncbi:SusC/RagA family TonB-linked outer membrane protein [Polaribacter sargassicola]|uniref:SusC/RagA family TonB-linked outer membrane protein n=1 Tax=Polaribacter sargassicola TaxID=2836891 RepID=UPI001F46669A|nr:TonB-dependent receptor [Polaribacter sp. DS7-9]MCG1037769.1 TonB-dependent receptor [Polaribacter sp. DS7-9]